MKTTRITAVALLIVVSAWALHVRPNPAGNTPAHGNRKEQSNMTSEKVIMLIEAKIQPLRRAELIDALRQYLPQVRS